MQHWSVFSDLVSTRCLLNVGSIGPIQCCNSVQSASSGGLVSVLLGLLGVVLGDVNVPIGVTCSPITVIGSGSAGW